MRIASYHVSDNLLNDLYGFMMEMTNDGSGFTANDAIQFLTDREVPEYVPRSEQHIPGQIFSRYVTSLKKEGRVQRRRSGPDDAQVYRNGAIVWEMARPYFPLLYSK